VTYSPLVDEDCSLEIAFLIDSSESAKDNHAQEKRFALDLMDRLQGLRLQTGRGLSSRAALLQYSSHVIIEKTFKQWRGTEDFKARISPIVYIGHGTYTTYAITNLTRIYSEESDTSSVKVAILLFDGISHPRNPDIFSAVADAKNQGVRFFAIGITPEANELANKAQLQHLDIVLFLPSQTAVADEGVSLEPHVFPDIFCYICPCRVHLTLLLLFFECKERPMELVFVIDSSESVGPENFEIIKDFVNALVDRVTVGRNATRIGLVLYSLEVRTVFNLARYITKQDVKNAIRNIPYMGEGTYTGTAIRKATQEVFHSSRLGVSKVAIVITDGQTDKREPSAISDLRWLQMCSIGVPVQCALSTGSRKGAAFVDVAFLLCAQQGEEQGSQLFLMQCG
uniref:Collagen, type XXVIII, alpha 2b n=1 Tax=Neolamprologus brichardi TaxID=32507 RepID=A0A3Q4I2F7_NEOBR